MLSNLKKIWSDNPELIGFGCVGVASVALTVASVLAWRKCVAIVGHPINEPVAVVGNSLEDVLKTIDVLEKTKKN